MSLPLLNSGAAADMSTRSHTKDMMVMDAWIASRMTAAEAEAFTERGWLEIDDALPPAVLEEMRAAVEAVREQKLEEGRDVDEVIRQCAFSAANSS